MENLRSILFWVVVILVVGIVGYWAIFTIEPGDIHAERRQIQELEEKNEQLTEEVERLQKELSALQPTEPTPAPESEVTPAPAPAPSTTTYKYQKLIDELQKLVDEKVVMKEKSRGTRVGTLQNFFNLYFSTNKRIDNDFGKTTKEDLIKFQKAVGLTADGQAGPTTYEKMIDWLEKQG